MEHEEPYERRDALRIEVAAMRTELKAHVDEEMPALRTMMQELGTSEQVRERRIFIELMINRERDRRKLRIALIEKGLLLAMLAVLVFIAQAVWREVAEAMKLMANR